jgi:hypothetical protein
MLLNPVYVQAQQSCLDYLEEQLGKGYSEQPGQNFGPWTFDCQGLAYETYEQLSIDIEYGEGGAHEQFDLSPYQLPPDAPWLLADQCFFHGGSEGPPFPGHTGIFVGIMGGQYTVINAFDSEDGVCYTTFDPTINQDEDNPDGMAFWGRTRPLLEIAQPFLLPKGNSMILVQTQGPQVGNVPADGWFEYEVTNGSRYAKHVVDEAQLNVLKIMYSQQWVTMTTAEFNELGCMVTKP